MSFLCKYMWLGWGFLLWIAGLFLIISELLILYNKYTKHQTGALPFSLPGFHSQKSALRQIAFASRPAEPPISWACLSLAARKRKGKVGGRADLSGVIWEEMEEAHTLVVVAFQTIQPAASFHMSKASCPRLLIVHNSAGGELQCSFSHKGMGVPASTQILITFCN